MSHPLAVPYAVTFIDQAQLRCAPSAQAARGATVIIEASSAQDAAAVVASAMTDIEVLTVVASGASVDALA